MFYSQATERRAFSFDPQALKAAFREQVVDSLEIIGRNFQFEPDTEKLNRIVSKGKARINNDDLKSTSIVELQSQLTGSNNILWSALCHTASASLEGTAALAVQSLAVMNDINLSSLQTDDYRPEFYYSKTADPEGVEVRSVAYFGNPYNTNSTTVLKVTTCYSIYLRVPCDSNLAPRNGQIKMTFGSDDNLWNLNIENIRVDEMHNVPHETQFPSVAPTIVMPILNK